MGSGESHPARVVLNGNTGALAQNLNPTFGPGGAALALFEEKLFVAGNKGLTVFQTSSITSGEMQRVCFISTKATDGFFTGFCTCALVVHVGLLYVVGGGGIAVVSLGGATPTLLTADGPIQTGVLANGSGVAACLVGDFLYVAGQGGLAVMDVKSDPERPQRVGDVIDTGVITKTACVAMKLIERGDARLLYAHSGRGLSVLDISADPSKPTRIGEVMTTGICTDGCTTIADSGSPEVLFVAGCKGLGILDISDPSAPKFVQKVETGVIIFGGGCAMVVDTSDELYGSTHTLMVAGSKGLGVFKVPPAQDMLAGAKPESMGSIDTGALSEMCETAILLDQATRMLYCAGGKGLAAFDLRKFDGATVALAPDEHQ